MADTAIGIWCFSFFLMFSSLVSFWILMKLSTFQYHNIHNDHLLSFHCRIKILVLFSDLAADCELDLCDHGIVDND